MRHQSLQEKIKYVRIAMKTFPLCESVPPVSRTVKYARFFRIPGDCLYSYTLGYI